MRMCGQHSKMISERQCALNDDASRIGRVKVVVNIKKTFESGTTLSGGNGKCDKMMKYRDKVTR